MKKIIALLSIIVTFSVTLNSCVKDTDFETPQISCEEPQIPSNQLTTIGAVIDEWNNQQNSGMFEFADDNPNTPALYLTGYVVSSDRTGNYYKELYIQDDPTNPQHALTLMIDMRSLFTKFDVGRKLYIKLNGLGIDQSRGEMVIGEVNGGDLEKIHKNKALEIIQRSCAPVEITPKVLNSVNDITTDMVGMYIKLDHMQFHYTLIGKTFVDPADSYDSHRKMVSCDDGAELQLETSTFASFKDHLLPEKSGSVEGILTRDYRDDYYVLKVNDIDAFDFTGARCDPAMLDCNGTSVGGNTVVFSEDFESYNANDTSFGGWTNVNVTGGNTVYKIANYSGNNYAQISAYHSNEPQMDVWLISPSINLDNSTGEELHFKTKTGYNNGAALTVYVSDDYTGDINAATWQLVNADIADGPSSGYMHDFVEGVADMSCLNGDVVIAFRYQGGDGGITTTFQIDDVAVKAN